MWNVVNIQLVSGVGNANLIISKAQILGDIAIPPQTAINSGVTKVVITHLLPDPPSTPFPILTLNTVTTPYEGIPKALGVSPANVADTQYGYRLIGSLNISITGGVASNTAQVWILLTDD